jgi:hypothetical protein
MMIAAELYGEHGMHVMQVFGRDFRGPGLQASDGTACY